MRPKPTRPSVHARTARVRAKARTATIVRPSLAQLHQLRDLLRAVDAEFQPSLRTKP